MEFVLKCSIYLEEESDVFPHVVAKQERKTIYSKSNFSPLLTENTFWPRSLCYRVIIGFISSEITKVESKQVVLSQQGVEQ